MKGYWLFIGIIAFCAIIVIIYLIRKNLNDEKEVEKSFNEEFKQKKDIDLIDDDF